MCRHCALGPLAWKSCRYYYSTQVFSRPDLPPLRENILHHYVALLFHYCPILCSGGKADLETYFLYGHYNNYKAPTIKRTNELRGSYMAPIVPRLPKSLHKSLVRPFLSRPWLSARECPWLSTSGSLLGIPGSP